MQSYSKKQEKYLQKSNERSKKKEVKLEVKEEVNKEVNKEVNPASWLEVKLFELDNTTRPQTIVHEQSSFTPTSVSEFTSPFTPNSTPSSKSFTPNSTPSSKSFTPNFIPHYFNSALCIDLTTILRSDRRPDGMLCPHFRLPHCTQYYTFRDFCREAAEELLLIDSLLEEEMSE